jgi:hypothetical protein
MAIDSQRRAFISYSRTNKDFATKLARGLRQAGFPIWFDLLDIPTGARWDDEVEKALRECSIFLIILTPASIASENVKDEIGYAIDHGKRILPVLLEDCDVPLRLRRFQYVDFTTKSFEEGFESAKELLGSLVSESTGQFHASLDNQASKSAPVIATPAPSPSPVVPVIATPSPAPAAPVKKKSSSKGIMLGVGLVVVVAILALGGGAVFFMSGGLPTTRVEKKQPTQVSQPTNPPQPTVAVKTPTPKATSVPNSPTPKPTVVANTPTPEVRQYMTLDFDGELKNWESFIVNGDTATISNEGIKNVTMDVEDGAYLFDLANNQVWGYSLYDAFEYDDVRVDASVENLGTNDNNVSLICRYSAGDGWYEFNVANNGLYWIYYAKPNATGLVSYRIIANGGSNKIKTGLAVNEYSIVCKGDDLMLYINDSLTKSTRDDLRTLDTGKVGVSVSSFNNYAKVKFDWIKISQP